VKGALLSVAALAIAGCDVEAEKAPTFTQINETILKPNCTFACHSGGVDAAGHLDLELTPYEALVGATAASDECAKSSMKRVAAGDPEQSLLYMMSFAKLHDMEAPCGGVMPLGEDRPSLTADELEGVRLWIANGAPND
jgi:hypothetical protein